MRQARERAASKEGTALVGVVPPPTPPADGDLIRQFNDIFRRLHPRLLSHAERILDRESARDAVSQTFLELWTRWPRMSPEQRSDQVFFGAVRHTAMDERDAMQRFVSLQDAEEEIERKIVAETSPPWRGVNAVDVADEALAKMPARRREVFLLVREEGFSYAEVAEQLDLSLGTVNTHMMRAWADIRAAYARAQVALPTNQPPRLPASKGGDNND
mgnify:CR=1 FL=1